MILRHVEEKAEKLLRDTACWQVPVDLEAIAKSLSFKLDEIDLDDEVSGLFVIKDKTERIGYNKWHHEHRQRFTIAHELGHCVLHAKSALLFVDKQEKILYRNLDSSSGEHQKEREA